MAMGKCCCLNAYLSNIRNIESQWFPTDNSVSSDEGFQHSSFRDDIDLQKQSQKHMVWICPNVNNINYNMREQLDKENKESGEKENEKPKREEVGTKACIIGKIVKSRMKWAGHMV